MAVPICVAIAAMSFWSPAVNGCPDRRSERFTTPSGSDSRGAGAVHMIGTESIAPRR